MSFDLFSIGHSNIPAERFVALLRDAGVDAIADVRSTPFSRRFPWFSGKNSGSDAGAARHGLSAHTAMRSAAGRAMPRSIATASPTMRRWRGSRTFKPGSTACSPMRRALASA